MMRRPVLWLVLGSVLGPMSAAASGEAAPRSVSLQVDPTRVTYGDSVTLTGKVVPGSGASASCVAGVTVTLRFIAVFLDPIPPPSYQWKPVGTATTDQGGSFSFTHTPASGGDYVATVEDQQPPGCEAEQSNRAPVRVRHRVDLEVSDRRVDAGSVVRFRVDVDPSCRFDPPAEVELQRRSDGRFVTVSSKTASSDRCVATFREPIGRTGVYRGFAKERTDFNFSYLAAASETERVRVAL